MRLTDDYINCDVLIKEANILYNNVKDWDYEHKWEKWAKNKNKIIWFSK